MKTLSFFNNKGGVGKTSLVYHLAWIFADHGIRVLAADLDPQANLTSMFLEEKRLEEIWPDEPNHPHSILGAIQPILKGTGDICPPLVEKINSNLGLLPGDLGLSSFEDKLSDAWPRCQNNDESSFRIMTAFHRTIVQMAGDWAEIVLIDVGPNLGAINRAALISSDDVCIPLAPDLYSLQGLKNLGPSLSNWRKVWESLKTKAPHDLSLPSGKINPLGYVVMQHGIRDSQPPKAYQRWINRIPETYHRSVLEERDYSAPTSPKDDSQCLAQLKHYRSLMPLAMEARKPIFHLKPSDGAIGAHLEAARDCREDFIQLAKRICSQVNINPDRFESL